MNTELVNKITRTFHKVGFKLKKHSPEILVVAGVIGAVTSAIVHKILHSVALLQHCFFSLPSFRERIYYTPAGQKCQ